uniref:Transposase n=1 Tax=Globodera rostochiensis TaxID=31243 RepID=A0A914H412_GLORO
MNIDSEVVFCPNKMEEFWILILVLFFATNSLDKAESVQLEELEELPLQTFDELFVDEWLDKDEAEDLKTPAPTNFGQNVHHQIDRQNTQIGQIEPNSTDQNPSLTKSYNSDNSKNGEEITSNEKQKFYQMKAMLKRAGFKNSYTKQIDKTVAKELGLSLATIYNWKSEFGQSRPNKYSHSEKKELLKLYYEIKDKNPNINDKKIVKMLKIGIATLYKWKKQFKLQQIHANSVDGHEENAGSNVQEIGHSNS